MAIPSQNASWLIAAMALVISTSAFANPWPLGALTLNPSLPGTCPSGYACSSFDVSAPRVTESTRGFLAVAPPQGSARGLVMFFTGGDGNSWWSDGGPEVHALGEELRAEGFMIVQVKWRDSWLVSSLGNDAGTGHLGCLPATVIRYVHDNYYVPLGVPTLVPGQAGFCVTGNSGGSSQVAYALSHFGLEDILDVVIPTGGPPHSVLDKSCMNRTGEEGYWYPLGTRQFIDRGFGYFDGNGPAARQDATFVPRWLEESVATGGNDYIHPETRIQFIFGDGDQGMQTVGGDYIARLMTEGSPSVSVELAPSTGHNVVQSPEGRAALKVAILGSGTSGVTEIAGTASLRLEPNRPNPFGSVTRIAFSNARASSVRLTVFDVQGREVARPVDRFVEAGSWTVEFASQKLPSGIYWYELTTPDGNRLRRKMTIAR